MPETLLSRRDLRCLFTDSSSSVVDDDAVDSDGGAIGSEPDALRAIGVFESFDDATAAGIVSGR